ncbi:uncharacterized protein L3040_002078 [Drepanopeziza brunnea f. sp. 'multigermtubi']|uniref:uncharacterized protein n=1 Tax=Drepanopeziza brunnea f. sp. 'multigermtubi' TaxID=698441 RepID=UPI00239C99A0|nr:hypothetical protein L3040_002078 [Drepanopeziza brunnea f. sp. 'multigermtubi']
MRPSAAAASHFQYQHALAAARFGGRPPNILTNGQTQQPARDDLTQQDPELAQIGTDLVPLDNSHGVGAAAYVVPPVPLIELLSRQGWPPESYDVHVVDFLNPLPIARLHCIDVE